MESLDPERTERESAKERHFRELAALEKAKRRATFPNNRQGRRSFERAEHKRGYQGYY